jgi:hypothetical protein
VCVKPFGVLQKELPKVTHNRQQLLTFGELNSKTVHSGINPFPFLISFLLIIGGAFTLYQYHQYQQQQQQYREFAEKERDYRRRTWWECNIISTYETSKQQKCKQQEK